MTTTHVRDLTLAVRPAGKRSRALLLAAVISWASLGVAAAPREPPPLQPLASLDVAPYMGRWYQVALYPNAFQKQCVSDTTATYRDLGKGMVEVLNRCRRADGSMDEAVGLARTVAEVSHIEGGRLQPARLEVNFLPAWLRWTGIAWGAYWVIDLAPDGRYALVSEARRDYLWVLSRTPGLTPEDRNTVRTRLLALGFNLDRLMEHPHTTP